MNRRVKCQLTGEYGDSDHFIKINGKYYKSQQIYNEYLTQINLKKEIIKTLAEDILDYENGQVFPTLLTKKLKELDFYPNEVILKTIKDNFDNIMYWMEHKQFKNDSGKIAYVFAIIKNSINDVYRSWKRDQKLMQEIAKGEQDGCFDESIMDLSSTRPPKDISRLLEVEDL